MALRLAAVALLALAAGAAALTCEFDEILKRGGTFRLHNHPRAEYVNANFGYGLRVDGLYNGTAGIIVVFDFDAPGSSVFLHYDKPNHVVHIFGTVVGGQLNGGFAQCNEGHCSIVNPRLYQLDYYYRHVSSTTSWVSSLYYADDGGFLRDALDGTTYNLGTSNMNPPSAQEFLIDLGQYRDYTAGYSGHGWVRLLGAEDIHYRDWSFVVGECVCNAVDRVVSQGGTYRLANHPRAEFTNPGMGYGLRLDGVLGDGSLVVFDFNREGSAVYLRYDKAAGTIHIYGKVWGGQLSGDSAACNAGPCSIVNPELYILDYWLHHVDNEGIQLTSSFYADDGGTLAATDQSHIFHIGSTQMQDVGKVFLVNFGQYRGETSAMSANGWVRVQDANPPELHYRDWGFILTDCACESLVDLIAGGGLFKVYNHPKAEYVNSNFGYGLRIDGLFDGSESSIVVFDFERGGANVNIKYDKAAATLRLFGLVLGGTLSGNAAVCNAGGCSITNPRLYRLEFMWLHIQNEGSQLVSFFNSDDAGTLTDVQTAQTWTIQTTEMAGAQFFVNYALYRGEVGGLSGYGWVATDKPRVGYRDWSFLIKECGCSAEDGLMGSGGTYRLHNHPKAEYVWANLGYGLRIDGIFDNPVGPTPSLAVFDFDAPDASVFLTFDAVNSRVHIFGHVVGGNLNGTIAQCNELQCVISNAAVFELDYWLTVFGHAETRQLAAFYRDGDGGWLREVGGAQRVFAIKGTVMSGAVFILNLGQYRQELTAYTGYGWVQLPLATPTELHAPYYRDWGFLVGECVPGFNDFCLYDGTPASENLVSKRRVAQSRSVPFSDSGSRSGSPGCAGDAQCRIVDDSAVCVVVPDQTTDTTSLRLVNLKLSDYPEKSLQRGELIDQIENDVVTALGLTDQRWRVYVSDLRAGSVIASVSFRDAPIVQLPNAVETQTPPAGATVSDLALQLALQASDTSSSLYGGKITRYTDSQYSPQRSGGGASFSSSPAGLAVIAVVGAAAVAAGVLVVRHVRRQRQRSHSTDVAYLAAQHEATGVSMEDGLSSISLPSLQTDKALPQSETQA